MERSFKQEVEEMKKLTLQQLQGRRRKCAFCPATNRNSEGHYYKNSFICHKCLQDIIRLNDLLTSRGD